MNHPHHHVHDASPGPGLSASSSRRGGRCELTSSQALAALEELLGTTADPTLHGGAEMEITSGDGDIAVLALARHYRVDGDGIWLRPLANPATKPGAPYFAEHGNQAMCLNANGPIQLHPGPPRIVLTEAGYQHNQPPTITIGPATNNRVQDVANWDWFTLNIADADRLRLAACTPEIESWPPDPNRAELMAAWPTEWGPLPT